VLSVESAIARSVTGPDAPVSAITRLSTAGEAAIAMTPTPSATVACTPIQRSAQ
jgi:hypothetical protein